MQEMCSLAFWHNVKKKMTAILFRYDLNNYARMHTLIMKIHNNHLLFRSSKLKGTNQNKPVSNDYKTP